MKLQVSSYITEKRGLAAAQQWFVTSVISFTLPAPFREQQEVNDLCRLGQGSVYAVVSEQTNWWRVSKACRVCVSTCVCVCVREQDTPCGGIR